MTTTASADDEQLRTDHLLRDLGTHAVTGGLTTAAAQGAKFVLNLAAVVVLARLLGPEAFGLVGVVLAVTGLLGLFKDAGLSTATVQSASLTQEQLSGLFWINVAFGGIATLAGIALAPLVAWFYHDARLTAIMVVLSTTFLITGSTVQHQAVLARRLRFRAIALIDVASMAAGVVTACALAGLGLAHWALVGQQLGGAAAGLALAWRTSRWRPSLPGRPRGVAPLLGFGARLTVSDLVGRLAATSDSLLIGRLYGPAQLGLYSRAHVLLARPMEQLLAPVGAVMVPVLSRLQGDPERYRRAFMHAYGTVALITFPFTALALALAEPLVLLVLGAQWKDAASLFAGFSLVALCLPLAIAATWLMVSQGRGRDLLRTYTVNACALLAAVLAGLPWGPVGVVLALAAVTATIRLPNLYYVAGRHGPVRTTDLWKGFFTHLPCWAAVFVATTLASGFIGEAEPLPRVLGCGLVGLAAGAGATFAFHGSRRSALFIGQALRSRGPWSHTTPVARA